MEVRHRENNLFNILSGPGAIDPGTVDLLTGKVNLSQLLTTVDGYALSLQYNSNVKEMVTTWNCDAPTGVVGLGWALPKDRIVCFNRGNVSIDSNQYYLNTQGGVYSLVCSKIDKDNNKRNYIIKEQPMWLIIYDVKNEQWNVIKEDGTRYIYGGQDNNKNFSIEHGVCWGNWVGSSVVPDHQELFPLCWNLSYIEDIFGQKVQFVYEQVLKPVGKNGREYTQACYLKQIIGSKNTKATLLYEEKGPEEYQFVHDKNPEAFQQKIETRYLSSVELYNEEDHLHFIVQLGYEYLNLNLNSKVNNMSKRMLTTVQQFNSERLPYAPPTSFSYYGLDPSDGVSVTRTSDEKIFNSETGAFFGSIKSVTSPSGAMQIYRFNCQKISTSAHALDIQKPSNIYLDTSTIELNVVSSPAADTVEVGWKNPQLFYGVDYVVIAWELDSYSKQMTSIQVAQWASGKWQLHDLGNFNAHLYDDYPLMDDYDPTMWQTLKKKIFDKISQIPLLKKWLDALQGRITGDIKTFYTVGKDLGDGDISKALDVLCKREWENIKGVVNLIWNQVTDIGNFFTNLFGYTPTLEKGKEGYDKNEQKLKKQNENYRKNNPRREFHIIVQKDFFAFATSYVGRSTLVFHKDPLQSGIWIKHTLPVDVASKYFEIVSGNQFVAVLDQMTDVLYVFTYDGEYVWNAGIQRLSNDENIVNKRCSITANNNILITLAADDSAGSSFDIRLYHHDELGVWQPPTVQTLETQLKKDVGITYVKLYSGNSFAAIALYGEDNSITREENLSFLLDPSETIVTDMLIGDIKRKLTLDMHKWNGFYGISWEKDFTKIKTTLLHVGVGEDASQIVVIDNTIHKTARDHSYLTGENGNTYAFRYDGIGFVASQFNNDYISSTLASDLSSQIRKKENDETKKITYFSEYNVTTVPAWPPNVPNGIIPIAIQPDKWKTLDNISNEEDAPEFVEEAISISIDILNLILMFFPFVGEAVEIGSVVEKMATGIGTFGETIADTIVALAMNSASKSGSITNKFILVGNQVYYRSNETWELLGTLNKNKEGNIKGNTNTLCGNIISYTIEKDNNYKNYVAILKNGCIYKNISVDDMQDMVTHADEMQQISGYNSFIAYGPITSVEPSSDDEKHVKNFSKATKFRLYRFENDMITGNLNDYVVQKIEIYNGVNSSFMHYAYDAETAVMSQTGQTAIYPKVTVIPSKQQDITLTQGVPNNVEGFIEHYFYNDFNYMGQGSGEILKGYPSSPNIIQLTDKNLVIYPREPDVDDHFDVCIPALLGKPYLTCLYRYFPDTKESKLEAYSSTHYKIFEQELLTFTNARKLRKFCILVDNQTDVQDGVNRKTTFDYTESVIGDIRPILRLTKVINANKTLTDAIDADNNKNFKILKESYIKSFSYATEVYPETQDANMLMQRIQTYSQYQQNENVSINVGVEATSYKSWSKEGDSNKRFAKERIFIAKKKISDNNPGKNLSHAGESLAKQASDLAQFEKTLADWNKQVGKTQEALRDAEAAAFEANLANEATQFVIKTLKSLEAERTLELKQLMEVTEEVKEAEQNVKNKEGDVSNAYNQYLDDLNQLPALVNNINSAKSELEGFQGFWRGFITGFTFGLDDEVKKSQDKIDAAIDAYNKQVQKVKNDYDFYLQEVKNLQHAIYQYHDALRLQEEIQKPLKDTETAINEANKACLEASNYSLTANDASSKASSELLIDSKFKELIDNHQAAANVHGQDDTQQNAFELHIKARNAFTKSQEILDQANKVILNFFYDKLIPNMLDEVWQKITSNIVNNIKVIPFAGEIATTISDNSHEIFNEYCRDNIISSFKRSAKTTFEDLSKINELIDLATKIVENFQSGKPLLENPLIPIAKSKENMTKIIAPILNSDEITNLLVDGWLHLITKEDHTGILKTIINKQWINECIKNILTTFDMEELTNKYELNIQLALINSQITSFLQNLMVQMHEITSGYHKNACLCHNFIKKAIESLSTFSPYNIIRETASAEEWIESLQVIKRDPETGTPLILRNAMGTISSIIYDKYMRFPIAQFSRGVAYEYVNPANPDERLNPEVGYCGFEPYEDHALWTPQSEAGTYKTVSIEGGLFHSSHAAYSKTAYSIYPKQFTPLMFPEKTSYVISAWVKPINGQVIQVGIHGGDHTSSSTDETWQYIEHVVNDPNNTHLPEVNCPQGGYVHHLSYRPADCQFGITVYDSFHLPLIKITNNGQQIRYIYNRFQQLIAAIDNTDCLVQPIKQIGYSRTLNNPKSTFDINKPNALLEIASKGNTFYSPLAGSTITLDKFDANNDFALRFALQSKNMPLAPSSIIEISFGKIRLSFTSSDDQGNKGTYKLQEDKHELDKFDGDLCLDWIIVVTGKSLLLYGDGLLLLKSNKISSASKDRISLHSSDQTIMFVDVIAANQIVISTSYLDGLGRVIQQQHLNNEPNDNLQIITSSNIYDGWGNHTVRTLPSVSGEFPSFRQQHIKGFDWNSGIMDGEVVDYYSKVNTDALLEEMSSIDASFAYARRTFTSSPNPRMEESSIPGDKFKIGTGNTTKIIYQNPQLKKSLIEHFNVPSDQQNLFHSTTTVLPRCINGHLALRNSVQDSFGRSLVKMSAIATVENSEVCSSSLAIYNDKGLPTLIARSPNYFDPKVKIPKSDIYHIAYTQTSSQADLLGLITQDSSPDEGVKIKIRDNLGRMRFEINNKDIFDLNNDRSVIYYFYDSQGRIIETGLYPVSYTNEQLDILMERLQLEANAPVWNPPNLKWKSKFFYDKSDEGNTNNLKGRLYKTQRNNREHIIETVYSYDQKGNAISVVLLIKLNDKTIAMKEVKYTYNSYGQAIQVNYPDNFQIYYKYDLWGRMVGVGTKDNPTYYASYFYDFDNRIVMAKLNQNQITLSYKYNLQRKLCKIEAKNNTSVEIFSEVLNYFDSKGCYQNGLITQINLEAQNTPKETIQYEYDLQEYLLSAEKNQNSKIIYGLDRNGNITEIKENSTVKHKYQDGSDQLIQVESGTTKDDVKYDLNGYINEMSTVLWGKTVIEYDPITQHTTRFVNGDNTQWVNFEYTSEGKRVIKSRNFIDPNGSKVNDTLLYVHGLSSLPIFEEEAESLFSDKKISRNYIYGPLGLIAVKDNTGVRFPIHDHLGSTRLLLNDKGEIVNKYNYLPFGKIESSNGSTDSSFRYLYTGQEYDVELKLHNFRARLYSPELRRFLITDSKHQFNNPYAYVGNDPINLIDPTGNVGEPPLNTLRREFGDNVVATYYQPHNLVIQKLISDAKELAEGSFSAETYAAALIQDDRMPFFVAAKNSRGAIARNNFLSGKWDYHLYKSIEIPTNRVQATVEYGDTATLEVAGLPEMKVTPLNAGKINIRYTTEIGTEYTSITEDFKDKDKVNFYSPNHTALSAKLTIYLKPDDRMTFAFQSYPHAEMNIRRALTDHETMVACGSSKPTCLNCARDHIRDEIYFGDITKESARYTSQLEEDLVIRD